MRLGRAVRFCWYLALFVVVGAFWLSCRGSHSPQADHGPQHISFSREAFGSRPSPTPNTLPQRLDATLRAAAFGSKSLLRHRLVLDRQGRIKILVQLHPKAAFPTIAGLVPFGRVGSIVTARATPQALRALSLSPDVLRVEAARRLTFRRHVASRHVISIASELTEQNKERVYKFTVPEGGTVTFEVSSARDQGRIQLSLCEDKDCQNVLKRDAPALGQPFPQGFTDPKDFPASRALLEHTFDKAGTLYLKVHPVDDKELGRFALVLHSADIPLAGQHLTEGDSADVGVAVMGVGASWVRQDQGVTGKGVLVGVIDSGLDWCHADFIRNEQSQVLRLWDQTLVPQQGDTSPSAELAGREGYGIEYDRAAISAAMKNCDLNKVRSVDTDSHGTHVAGVAVGGGEVPGVAPGADLVVVKNAEDSAAVVDAIRYLVKLAEQRKQPLVINMSLGDNNGPADGTTLDEKVVTGVVKPGVNIVVSAGNEARKAIYAKIDSKASATTDLKFQLSTDANGNRSFSLYADPNDTFEMELKAPNGDSVKGVSGESIRKTSGGVAFELNLNADKTLRTQVSTVSLQIPDSPDDVQTWTLTITRTGGSGTGLVHAFIPHLDQSLAFASNVPRYEDNSVHTTIVSPASSPGSLTVGSYALGYVFDVPNFFLEAFLVPGNISIFSSRGPTLDGRPGLDVTTSGDALYSALSRHCKLDPRPGHCKSLEANTLPGGKYAVFQGTSQAAPVVAGATALMLEKDPTLFVRPLFRSTASKPSCCDKPIASMWGTGVLRLPAAMEQWEQGKAPTLKVEVEGETEGDAPFKVSLKASSTNNVEPSEYFWDLDGDGANDAIHDQNTATATLTREGTYTLRVIGVADSGRAGTATVEVKVRGNAPAPDGGTNNPDAGTNLQPDGGTNTPEQPAKQGCGCSASFSSPLGFLLVGAFVLLLGLPRKRTSLG